MFRDPVIYSSAVFLQVKMTSEAWQGNTSGSMGPVLAIISFLQAKGSIILTPNPGTTDVIHRPKVMNRVLSFVRDVEEDPGVLRSARCPEPRL